MNYKKTIQIILIIDFLFLTLLGVVSFKFLGEQLRKNQEMDPEILAQYNITLEIDKFLNLVEQLEKYNSP